MTTLSTRLGAHRLALLPLLLTLPLGAQASNRPTFGFSAQLNVPMGDLKEDTNKSVGAGSSFLVQWDLGQGHALRPRLDVNLFNVSAYSPSNNYRESRTLSAVGLGADYLYYVDGTPKGLYLTAGLGVTRWDLTYTSSDRSGNTYTASYDSSKNTTSLDLALGLGWQFTRVVGLEGRFIHAPYKAYDLVNPLSTNRTEVNRDGNFLQVAATFRW